MKKVLSVLMVAVALMMAAPAQAQLIKFGVKGGMDFTELDTNVKAFNEVAESSTGFFIGPMAEVTLPIIGLGVDGAVMFAQRGKDELKQQGIEIPVNLKYMFRHVYSRIRIIKIMNVILWVLSLIILI